MTTRTLGPPPWSDAELAKAYFWDFQSAYRTIEELPGARVHRALSEMQFSVDLFIDSTDDVLNAVKDFKLSATDPMFWTRARRAEFDLIERKIRKTLFGATSAALALVEHARRTSKDFVVDEYKEKLRETFDDEQHRFIQDLRNFASHVSVLQPEWEQRHANRQKETKLLLMPEFLLRNEKWSHAGGTFIRKHPEGIELEELFFEYRTRVAGFYRWYLPRVEERYSVSLLEYRKYRRALDRLGSHSFWTWLFSQVVIPRHLDPYRYLHQYLSEAELAEVRRLPDRSREQADRIISLVDEFDACDEKLRELVYRVFEVST